MKPIKRYKVRAMDLETGESFVLLIHATSAAEARMIAENDGNAVGSITPVKEVYA